MTQSTLSSLRAARTRAAADKHLGMLIGDDLLVAPILSVQEIVGLQEITTVPRMPAHFRGVINLRGRVVAVVELRVRLGLPRVPDTKRTCIVVSQMQGGEGPVLMGLLVDQVTEVLDIPKEAIDPAKELGDGGIAMDRSHLAGIARIGKKIAMVLDLGKLLGQPPPLDPPAPAAQ